MTSRSRSLNRCACLARLPNRLLVHQKFAGAPRRTMMKAALFILAAAASFAEAGITKVKVFQFGGTTVRATDSDPETDVNGVVSH